MFFFMVERNNSVKRRVVLTKVSFEECLAKLNAHSRGSFVYRGVSSSEHELIPSALRVHAFDNVASLNSYYYTNYDKPRNGFSACFEKLSSSSKQIYHELSLLYNFYLMSNYYGLYTPKVKIFNQTVDPYHLFTKFNEIFSTWYPQSIDVKSKIPNDFLFDDFLTLVALAAHHGLPTRMLDWSYEAYVALYFAVNGATKTYLSRLQNNESLEDLYFSVFIIELTDIQNLNGVIKFTTPNYHTNPNLSAQKGLMLYVEHPFETPLSEQRLPLDSVFGSDKVLRFDVSYNEIPQAQSFLFSRGITGALLFPGYNGVIKAIEESSLYQRCSQFTRNSDL